MKRLWDGAALALGLTPVLSLTALGHEGRMARSGMSSAMGMMGSQMREAESEMMAHMSQMQKRISEIMAGPPPEKK